MDVTVVDGDLTAELFELLSVEAVVAVDTETTGLDWRADRLQICQFFAPSCGAVIVRSTGGGADRAVRLLQSDAVLKVFHFAPFDLRFLESGWGAAVRNLACTKAASKLVDPSLPIQDHSLGALVWRNLGIRLDKGPVRTSDWGAPMLTEEQLAYAAADVAYLPALYARLSEQLSKLGLFSTYRSVCDYMAVDAHLEISGVPDPLKY